MRYEDIVNTIARQIAGVAEGYAPDKRVVVCPERIFVDDYLPKEEEYVEKSINMMPIGEDNPNEPPFHDRIFVVVKFGSGQRNMAISNSVVTIQVLSENDDFLAARDILDAFTAEYNFEASDVLDVDGNKIGTMVQAYFTPEVMASQEAVYTGFRALLSCRGFVRVPEPGYVFATSLEVSYEDGDGYRDTVKIPFINLTYNYSAQPDPQAFAGYEGQTMSLNRQSTEMVSFATYLQIGSGYNGNGFGLAVLGARNKMNAKFRLRFETNAYVKMGNAVKKFDMIDGWFVLVGANYAQDLGDMSPWTLSFAKAKEVED